MSLLSVWRIVFLSNLLITCQYFRENWLSILANFLAKYDNFALKNLILV